MIFMLDLVGHIGYIFIVVGMILLTQKNKFGWTMRFLGEFIWTMLGFYMEMSSIWFWGLVFMAIDLHGYHEWRRKEEWHV